MSFEWINRHMRLIEKPENYAGKTLAAYRLGMQAGGAIRGVSIMVGDDCCSAAKALPHLKVYHPDDAPVLPLSDCPYGKHCRCMYRPVMEYSEVED